MRPPLALAALLLVPVATSAADVRWEFEAGDTHTYAFTQTSSAEVTQFGQTGPVKNDLAFTLKWAVKSVNDDGSAVVEQTVERVKVATTAGDAAPDVYDSAATGDDARDPATLPVRVRVLGQMAGETFTATVAPDGTASGLTIPDDLARAIAAAGPGNPFGTEQVTLLFTDLGYALPPAGTAVGDTYKTDVVMPLSFGKVIDARTMTLTAADDATAAIELKSAFRSADKDAPVKVEQGTQTGAVVFDTAEGRLSAVNTTQTAELTGAGGFAVKLKSVSALKRTGD